MLPALNKQEVDRADLQPGTSPEDAWVFEVGSIRWVVVCLNAHLAAYVPWNCVVVTLTTQHQTVGSAWECYMGEGPVMLVGWDIASTSASPSLRV